MSSHSHVTEPITVGGLPLRNRVAMLPMGTMMCDPDGRTSDRQVAYYAARARGGTGLVIVEGTGVSDDYEVLAGVHRADSDDCIPALRRLTEAVHAAGGTVAIQLTPGLGRNNPSFTPERPPVSASDNPSFFDPAVTCRPLEADEVEHLVERYAEAVERCATAGFDMVDVHAHTGYLVDQFLGPQWNRRTDRYGGTVVNRARFAVELVQAAKRAAPGIAVSLRLTADNHVPGGRSPAETQEIARLLEAAGLDLLIVDEGSYEAMDYVFPPYYLGDGCFLPSARLVKAAVSIPVMACGNLDADTAERALAAGDCDMVGVGRGLIADPEYAGKLAADRALDVRPCIRCNQMCTGNALSGTAVGCAVNAQAGFELERAIVAAPTPGRVVVVGGGPAGLEAARVAALRGHTVDLYERTDHLGGMLWPAASPDFKAQLRSMVGWWEHQLANLPVTVHRRTEITAGSPELDGATAVVVATGSHPLKPGSIPGIAGATVVDVVDAHLGAPVGNRVLVAGGGLSGCDVALELARTGREVTIVEMLGEVARDMLPLNRLTLMHHLREAGVRILTSHTIEGIDEKGMTVQGPDGELHLDADTVVLALGVLPASELATALAGRPGVVAVGDCVTPAKVGEAVNAAFLAAAAI
jgi:2,4-dienoyl-CoA reductase-like NADH-dependent reductase (Old Yellow Enzyme family)/thioredoxin reductase